MPIWVGIIEIAGILVTVGMVVFLLRSMFREKS
jgi:hypothetical protein